MTMRVMTKPAATTTGRRPLPHVLCVMLAMLALLVVVPMAVAQPRMPSEPQLPSLSSGVWFGDPARDELIVNAHIGHGGRAITDRWTPMRLTIASTSLEGYEGIVRVRVAIDSEVSVYEAPFALQPGTGRERRRETTTVFLGIVAAGPFPERYAIEFEIIARPLGTTDRPTVLQRGAFNTPANPPSLGPPMGIDRGDPIVLVVGQSSAHSSAIATYGNNTHFGHVGGMRSRNQVQMIATAVEDLPFPASRWMLYDGYDAVVLSREALAAMGEARKRALRGWVEYGGHLVIMSDLLGTGADQLLPSGLLSVAIVGDAERGGGTGRVSITPTQQGKAMGWSALPLPGMPTGTAASGPVGLGWMTVLGTDPAVGREFEDINAIWNAILRIDALLALRRTMAGESGVMYGSGWGMSGDHGALRGSLDHAAYTLGVQPLSGWIIGLLVLGIGMVIAIGTTFGDWFLLGSARRRRLSFLTALGWLIGGSAVALVVPMLLRAGETSAVRIQVIDINEANGGVACSEVFAISTGRRLRFVPPGQGPESWSRRVSASERRGIATGALASDQFAGNSLGSGVASLWTFHAAVNEAVGSVPGLERGALDFGARITVQSMASGDHPVLELRSGLGRIANDAVFVAFKRAEPSFRSDVDSGMVSLSVPAPAMGAGLDRHRIVLRAGTEPMGLNDGFWHRGFVNRSPGWSGRRVGDDPKLLSGLPGVSLRNAAVHAALGTGRYAVVTMRFIDANDKAAAIDREAYAGMTEPTGLVERGVTHRWVRILVPIEESTREALVALYDAGLDLPASDGDMP